MRTWRVGTFSLGLLLVLFGVFLLLSQLFKWESAYILVSWWPLLLIVLGIEMLVYLFLANKESEAIKFDFLSIILVSVIGFVGISLTILSTTGILDEVNIWLKTEVKMGELPAYSLHLDESVKRIVVQVAHPLTIESSPSNEVALFGTYRLETPPDQQPFQSSEDYMSSVLQGDTLYVTLIDDVYAMPAYRSVPPILKTTLIVPEHIALEVHSNHELVTIKPRIIANHWTISDAGAVDAYMHTDANATLYAENVSEIIGEEAKWEITESPPQQEEQVEQGDNYETNSNVKLGTLTIGSGANRIQILNSSSLSVSLIHTE